MKNLKDSNIQDKKGRKRDPYLDRRSGEDRRAVYSLDYFLKGNPDRRNGKERRKNSERRSGCVRINEWSSVCLNNDEKEEEEETYVVTS